MVLIKEYRVVLPVSVEEYQVGQLYSVAEASKNETGGGEGIEVLKNEPYEKEGEKGQYTHKIYHLKSKVPGFVKMIAPEGSLVFHEKAWNAYPYCRTASRPHISDLSVCFSLQNEYMKDDFMIEIKTWHKPDLGTLENVHQLDEQTLREVEVVPIDIANKDEVAPGDYKPEEDPALFHSAKTGRGPLSPEWKVRDEGATLSAVRGVRVLSFCLVFTERAEVRVSPHVCVQAGHRQVQVVGSADQGGELHPQGRARPSSQQRPSPSYSLSLCFLSQQEKRIFTNFHRQLFCWIDRWVGLTMEDIRRMEDETQRELEEVV
ncbi:unnamed protein product, partial [Tetraodon nigroviridis]